MRDKRHFWRAAAHCNCCEFLFLKSLMINTCMNCNIPRIWHILLSRWQGSFPVRKRTGTLRILRARERERIWGSGGGAPSGVQGRAPGQGGEAPWSWRHFTAEESKFVTLIYVKPKFCSYMPKRTGTAFRWSKKEQERRSDAFRLETKSGRWRFKC